MGPPIWGRCSPSSWPSSRCGPETPHPTRPPPPPQPLYKAGATPRCPHSAASRPGPSGGQVYPGPCRRWSPMPGVLGSWCEGQPGGSADNRPAPQAESSRRLGHPQAAPPAVRLPSLGEGLLQFRERITDGFLTSRKLQARHQEHSLSTAHLRPPWAEPPGSVGRAV